MTAFTHMESSPEIPGGKPCNKGTRISVELIRELMASGESEEMVKAYPHLAAAGCAGKLSCSQRMTPV